MFFSVPYDSGWSATVNGEPVVIEKASVGFMAVRVPAGEAEIRFEYMTPGLIPGAFVSAGGLVLLGVYLLVMRRQDRAGRCRGPGACQLPQPAGAPGGEHPVRADRADSRNPRAGSGTARTGDPGREGGQDHETE